MLKFTFGNSKLQKGETIFDLPAGHSCPFAHQCLSKADRITGKMTDGPAQEFRCYAASMENYLPRAREVRWGNFDTLRGKSRKEMKQIILGSLPNSLRYRIHSSGDFFSQNYFDAWMDVARKFPERAFYAYTKALPFWIKRKRTIPANFHLNASYGGTHDHLIPIHNLKYSFVVDSEDHAKMLGLEIDHDDSHAWGNTKPFALHLHGNGKAGSFQAKVHYLNKVKKAQEKAKTESALQSA